MRMQACVNGSRLPGEHPALPVSAAELARDVAAVVAAGATSVHLHVKDDAGADTLDGAVIATVLPAVRAAAPGVPIGITTGAWAAPETAERLSRIRAWTVLPDAASVNWHEDGAEQVAVALLERGVAVDAGLWHAEAVAAWTASGLRDRCARVLLELPDGPDADGTHRLADELLALVGTGPPVQLHGEGSSTWPALRHAAALGLDTRIGLEDTLYLPDGSPAPDNAALVRAAAQLLRPGDLLTARPARLSPRRSGPRRRRAWSRRR